jgi:hypothetical protein
MSCEKNINIVSFDIPYPADYGGVIDVFYKIKALHKLGFQIYLHCYEYGRKRQPELLKYCKEVYYYKRKKFTTGYLAGYPYIVATRNGNALLNNLLQNDYPILYEGLHTTYSLDNPLLKSRFKMVRTHNIEHEYYYHLSHNETNILKKNFFEKESKRLKDYEKVLNHADSILAISKKDTEYLTDKYKNVSYVPAFHQNSSVNIISYSEPFVLYHGNLSVSENYNAVIYLVNNVFSKIEHKCIIAGNGNLSNIQELIKNYPNIELINPVTTKEINNLIEKAHINILATSQSTGIKLKLINVLYKAKHILVNEPMIEGTGLEGLCKVCSNAEKFIVSINSLIEKPFDFEAINFRKEKLKEFDTEINALKILEVLEISREVI